jgi:predicted transcriptional regulator
MPRSKLDFLAHVLQAARNGTTREHITSQSDAGHGLVDISLDLLEDLSLLAERHNSPVSFVTTEKGHQFLQDYTRLTKNLGTDDSLK